MNSQSPDCLCNMFIRDDAGCQDVPDPIRPIGIRLLRLFPTRTNISSFCTTTSSPMFIESISLAGCEAFAGWFVCVAGCSVMAGIPGSPGILGVTGVG